MGLDGRGRHVPLSIFPSPLVVLSFSFPRGNSGMKDGIYWCKFVGEVYGAQHGANRGDPGCTEMYKATTLFCLLLLLLLLLLPSSFFSPSFFFLSVQLTDAR